MYDQSIDNTVPDDTDEPVADAGGIEANRTKTPEDEATAQEKAKVQKIIATIKADKRHHEKVFKRMRRDMQVAMWGAEKEWGDARYRANIAGRHVRQKTAALYAKNPRATAVRREQIDFMLWDENPDSLKLAMQTIQLAEQQMKAAQAEAAATDAANAAATSPAALTAGNPALGAPPAVPDPVTGAYSGPRPHPLPGFAEPATPAVPQFEAPPGFEQAQALLADFQQGYARRQLYSKIGKTLEILYSYQLSQQKPLGFKQLMKKLVRRTLTTSVGYVELGFLRETGPREGLTAELEDAQTRLAHLQQLAQDLAEGEIDEDSAERAELEASIAALQSEPYVVKREGLVVETPQSTKIIPDRDCIDLEGFFGANHLTREYNYSAEKVKEIFKVDLGSEYTSYTQQNGLARQISSNDVLDDEYEWAPSDKKRGGKACVWKYFEKDSGLVYYVCDGYPRYLKPPGPPDVAVENFWPIFALTFNAVENEDELFPPSDVSLMIDMQREHNRARHGKREHREAARPRWVAANGAFGDEEDPLVLKKLKPFELAMLNMSPEAKIGDILQEVPVPGVDPNLYETSETFTDTQLVVGSQEAQFGGVSKATATESAIAANSSTSADGSSIDDLDAFLTLIARSSGQILMKEMSEEQVKKIVGQGAMWPTETMQEIADEVFLEVAAGSTGKPNQAVQISNMERLLPLLIQIPGISPQGLAREVLLRLDDKLDLTSLLAAGIPSIVSQNAMARPAAPPAANPGNDPSLQGAKGGMNAPKPGGGPGGSPPAFGSNQV